MEPLTEEQINFAVQRMAEWIEIRNREWEQLENSSHKATPELKQLYPDIHHSALLHRQKALPKAPPTRMSYPVYPIDAKCGLPKSYHDSTQEVLRRGFEPLFKEDNHLFEEMNKIN
jgi:hypothetical protein